jgi:hypothetical protein
VVVITPAKRITPQQAARYQYKNLSPQFELLLMKWLIRFIITLFSHIITQGRFISMLTDRADVISLSPKFPTPQNPLDLRNLPEYLSGCYALDGLHHLLGAISWNRLKFSGPAYRRSILENRVGLSSSLRHPAAGHSGDHRGHRGLFQPTAYTEAGGVSISGSLRAPVL